LAGGILDISKPLSDGMTNERVHQRLDRMSRARASAASGGGLPAIDNPAGGPDHRLVGPTHDVARLFKALRAVREGRIEYARDGVRMAATQYSADSQQYAQISGVGDAAVVLVLHWAGDFFSKRSLPIPGMSKLASLGRPELVKKLFEAYRAGANLRTLVSQFLSSLSGVALIGILVTVFRGIDRIWISASHRPLDAFLGLAADVRFRIMSRNANLVALALSTGAAAVQQNIFRLNHLALARFVADGYALERMLGQRIKDADARTDRILGQLEAGEL
jgi:hypothetical protein